MDDRSDYTVLVKVTTQANLASYPQRDRKWIHIFISSSRQRYNTGRNNI